MPTGTMSRVFTDENLLTWEVYPSGGKFGLPENPKIVFQCLSEPNRRPRYVVHSGDEVNAEELVHGASDDQLRALVGTSRELN